MFDLATYPQIFSLFLKAVFPVGIREVLGLTTECDAGLPGLTAEYGTRWYPDGLQIKVRIGLDFLHTLQVYLSHLN